MAGKYLYVLRFNGACLTLLSVLIRIFWIGKSCNIRQNCSRSTLLTPEPVSFALVGCGYICGYNRYCLKFHPDELRLRGVYDRDAASWPPMQAVGR